MFNINLKFLFVLIFAQLLCFSEIQASAEPSNVYKGVNYLTGYGTDQLNCSGSNTAQINADMKELTPLNMQWIRVETYMNQPSNPSCKLLPQFQGLKNMLEGIKTTKAQPLINILGYQYPTSIRSSYLNWLKMLLINAPDAMAFEIGNEENLSNSTEGYSGAPRDTYPYGWTFQSSDYSSSDPVGVCPTDSKKNADLENAVTAYVAWLADTYKTIKSRRPGATVIIGGLSSWQSKCWLQKMGQHQAYLYADAIAYHPYGANPGASVQMLNYPIDAMQSWPKKLPLWATEFGYTSVQNSSNSEATEQNKASALTQTFNLLATKVAGPIIYYSARDLSLTPAQWQSQCSYVACVPDPKGLISETTVTKGVKTTKYYDPSGAGLFEYYNGELIKEPSYAAFEELEPAHIPITIITPLPR